MAAGLQLVKGGPLEVVDYFTVRDGQWDAGTGKQYAIQGDKLRQYAGQDIPGKGGAVHIFVQAPIGAEVTFITDSGLVVPALGHPPLIALMENNGWVNMPMSRDSNYNPDAGQNGPWQVWVDGVKVAYGIGLPHWWHVSTFLVVEDMSDVALPTEPIPPAGQWVRLVLQTMVDSTMVKEEELWSS